MADADALRTTPDRGRVPPAVSVSTGSGTVSLFQRGLIGAQRQRGHGRIGKRLWLRPGVLPDPYPDLVTIDHRNPLAEILSNRYIPL